MTAIDVIVPRYMYGTLNRLLENFVGTVWTMIIGVISEQNLMELTLIGTGRVNRSLQAR